MSGAARSATLGVSAEAATSASPADLTPLVSIVVACYKRAHLLPGLLDALANQTYRNFELICVDQTGETEIREILRRSPLGTKYVRYQPPDLRRRPGKTAPSNASGARNSGVLAARGELIAFTDDDCVPERDWLEKLTEPMRLDNKVIAVTGSVAPERATAAERRCRGRQRPQLFYDQGGAGTLGVRRNVFCELGGFDMTIGPGTDVWGAEDTHLIYRFLDHAGRTDSEVAGRPDACITNPLPDRWRRLRREWHYWRSQGIVWGREEALRQDKVATDLFDEMGADMWRRWRQSVQRNTKYFVVAIPLQYAALRTGRKHGHRMADLRTNIPGSAAHLLA